MKEKSIALGQNDRSLIWNPLKATRMIPQAVRDIGSNPRWMQTSEKRGHMILMQEQRHFKRHWNAQLGSVWLSDEWLSMLHHLQKIRPETKGIQKRIQKRNKSSSDNHKHLATQQIWVHKLSNVDPVIWSNTLQMQRQKTPLIFKAAAHILNPRQCAHLENRKATAYVFL